MSGGRGLEDFKGFTDTSAPSCGQTFTSTPGCSEAPTGRLPSYMAVAATGQLTRAREVISGRVVKVLVVKTEREPRLRGLGQIVATMCS